MNKSMNKRVQAIVKEIETLLERGEIEEKIAIANAIRQALHKAGGQEDPINCVLWVDINKVEANDYNPNQVANKEMGLLYKSIKADGYTQPVVTVYDKERDKYVIIDGFHRYSVCKKMQDIRERTHDKLPVVVLDKTLDERMAATVRHNRARGEHTIHGMSTLVHSMLGDGMTDEAVCNELGLEADELVRLKHLTGFSKLFENAKYNQSWKDTKQLELEAEYKKKQSKLD